MVQYETVIDANSFMCVFVPPARVVAVAAASIFVFLVRGIAAHTAQTHPARVVCVQAHVAILPAWLVPSTVVAISRATATAVVASLECARVLMPHAGAARARSCRHIPSCRKDQTSGVGINYVALH